MLRCLLHLFLSFLLITPTSQLFSNTKPNSVLSVDNEPAWGLGLYCSSIKMMLGRVDHSTIDQWMGLSLKYRLDPYTFFSLTTGYGWVYPRNPEGSQYAAFSHYKTILLPIHFCGHLCLLKSDKFKPYLTFGTGATYWEVRDFPQKHLRNISEYSVVRTQLSPALVGGFGLETRLVSNVTLDLGLKFQLLLKGDEDTIGTGDDNRGIVEFCVAFNFFLPNNFDIDQDGISNKFDKDPVIPEDFDGFMDDDGIPDMDNDNDGLLDVFDKAPDSPEDIDGFEDADGIPDPDNDGDGILDQNDLCPDLPEDFDGFNDRDGCPDVDNDDDSIPDLQDKCPNCPEIYNGYEDEDGCPDNKPEALLLSSRLTRAFQQQIPVNLYSVIFEDRTAKILNATCPEILAWIHLLQKYPGTEIEVRGHVSSFGSPVREITLSQQRASAIKSVMLNYKIAARRIRVIGMGAEKPLPTFNVVQGNNRIEIVRVK